jgi:hypothetical protein
MDEMVRCEFDRSSGIGWSINVHRIFQISPKAANSDFPDEPLRSNRTGNGKHLS